MYGGGGVERLPQIILEKQITIPDTLLLYVDVYYPENTVEEVQHSLEYESVDLLYDNEFTKIYVLMN